MSISISELNRLLQTPSYSRFINTNLHLHTPATPWDWDSKESQTNHSTTITPESYFEHLNKTSLELVAITDRNCISWCRPLISIAKEARKEGKSKIHILPGVELNTWEGPHLCAIFSEDIDITKIEKMLTRLGLSGKGLKDEQANQLSEDTQISKIIIEVEKLQGLIIAPHVHNKDGVFGNKEFSGRMNILNNPSLRILATPSGDIKRVDEGNGKVRLLHKHMDSSLITNSFGFIDVADCHRLEDFEVNTTWVKMTSPNLEGVRQIIFEPELRISHTLGISSPEYENQITINFCSPPEISHPYILALTVNGGMLDGLEVQFSPHQNTIIGLNYAGKTALLDCIRFALNMEPTDEKLLTTFCKRIQAFVGIAGSVSIYCQNYDKSILGISRTCLLTRTKPGTSKESIQFEGASEIFSLIEDEFRHDTGVNIEKIFRPELYAQGEVASIKNNVDQQMRIVNNLARIDIDLQEICETHKNGTLTILGKLTENASSLVNYQNQVWDLEENIIDIEPLNQEIEELEKLETSPLYTEKKQWADAGVTIGANIYNLSNLQEKWVVSGLIPETDEGEDTDTTSNETEQSASIFDENKSTPEEYFNQASKIFKSTVLELEVSVKSNLTLLQESLDSLSSLEAARKIRETSIDDKIRESVTSKDLGTKGDALISRLTEKRVRLQQLQSKQTELTNIKRKITELTKTRQSLLEEFRRARDRIRDSRLKVVQTIDSQSLPNIKAELMYDADKSEYQKLLIDIANNLTDSTNRIQNKDKQIDLITDSVTPIELIELIRMGEPNQLCSKCSDITPNTARIFFNITLEDSYKLEACLLEDSFIISFMRHGDTDFTPINEGLSGGEQSLALISVAMIPKDIPLVIDQPEDELGPALITHDLVEQIRNVKPLRQLIFVTHVPNIPVLADSEQIIYIQQSLSPSGKTSDAKCCGSLDNQDIVEHLLELDGGIIAFQKRSQRYSPFLVKA